MQRFLTNFNFIGLFLYPQITSEKKRLYQRFPVINGIERDPWHEGLEWMFIISIILFLLSLFIKLLSIK